MHNVLGGQTQRRYSTPLASERHASNAAYDLIDEGEGKQEARGAGWKQRKIQNSITHNPTRAVNSNS